MINLGCNFLSLLNLPLINKLNLEEDYVALVFPLQSLQHVMFKICVLS